MIYEALNGYSYRLLPGTSNTRLNVPIQIVKKYITVYFSYNGTGPTASIQDVDLNTYKDYDVVTFHGIGLSNGGKITKTIGWFRMNSKLGKDGKSRYIFKTQLK